MISEIVNILEEIAIGMNKSASVEDFSKYVQKKHEKSMVAAAYSWIYEKMRRDHSEQTGYYSRSSRILSSEELEIITVENYNYLLHFYNIGLLSASDMDSLFEKLTLIAGDEVSKDIINILVLSLFIDTDTSALPGSRLLLNSSDTIN